MTSWESSPLRDHALEHLMSTLSMSFEEQRFERLADSVYEYIDEQVDGENVGCELLVADLKKVFRELREDYVSRLKGVRAIEKFLED
jgi:hypothetical protein